MGYDIHITRANEWSDIGPGEEIVDQEWLDHVASDPALTLSAENGEYFAVWSGPSRDPDPWFDWSDGQIHTKNPDPAIIAKAIEIARALRARVQGDDGEIYLPDGQVERGGVVEGGPQNDWRTW